MRIYLAAPFFNLVQLFRVNHTRDILQRQPWPGTEFPPHVYCPHEHMILPTNATRAMRKDVFQSNMNEVRRSQVLVAILDEKDTGTIWEMGFAHDKVPTYGVYYDKGLKINVMLAEGCIRIYDGVEAFERFLQGIPNTHWDPKEVY